MTQESPIAPAKPAQQADNLNEDLSIQKLPSSRSRESKAELMLEQSGGFLIRAFNERGSRFYIAFLGGHWREIKGIDAFENFALGACYAKKRFDAVHG